MDRLALEANLAVLKDIFRPAAPTVDRTLFKGRDSELGLVVGSLQEVGMHAVIYGERGVGKTSLGNMAIEAFGIVNPLSLTLRVTCNIEDDFESVWAKIPSVLQRQVDLAPADVRESLTDLSDRVGDILQLDGCSPDNVARALYILGRNIPTLVVIDEFDRIGNWDSTRLFPDLIKGMSDDPTAVTLALIGVADDVDGLVQGHGSIDRAMRQIHMPRMTQEELAQIVHDGVQQFASRTQYELELDERVVDSISTLSQGFPYYTHLLAGGIVEAAVRDGRHDIPARDVFTTLLKSLDSASQSIRLAYANAVQSQQNATYRETLLACAMARPDVLGYFTAADVAPPLSDIHGKARRQQSFNHHLRKFTERPNQVLEEKGTTRLRYRYADPLMKPFVLMTGMRDGMLQLPDAD